MSNDMTQDQGLALYYMHENMSGKFMDMDTLKQRLHNALSRAASNQEHIISPSHCALLYLSQQFLPLKHVFEKGQYEDCDFCNIMAVSVCLRCHEPHKALRFARKIKDAEARMLRQKTVELWQTIHAPLEKEPRVHLLLLSYNRAAYIETALKELAATDYSNYAVYIADNASTDGSWDIVKNAKDFFPGHIPVYVERLPTNIGRPIGHNWLLTNHSHDEAEYIAIGDDDLVSVPQNWLQMMINTCKAIPGCGCVGGKALTPGMPSKIHGGVRNFTAFDIGIIELTNGTEQNDLGQFDFIDIVDHVIGCLHIFDKQALDAAGLFDISLSPCQCVDIEHHLRMNFAGYSIAFNGLIEFEHLRAMGTAVAADRTLGGNSIGNAIKLSYKYNKQMAHERLLNRQKNRNQWLTEGKLNDTSRNRTGQKDMA